MIKEKENNFVSAVIYIHNNASELYSFMKRLYAQLDKNFSKYEIICVNDDSNDDSVSILKEFTKTVKSGTITLINMSFHQGCEASMIAGVDLAIGDFIFEFDYASENIPVEKMFKIYTHALTGYDMVSVAPFKTAKLTQRIFYYIFNKFSYLHFRIQSEAFRIISRRAINRCKALSKTIPYRKAIYAESGLKHDTLYFKEVTQLNNFEDKCKMFNTALNSLILFTSSTNKLTFVLTLFFMFVCFFVFVYIVYIYIKGYPVEGWTTTMLFLSFVFFNIFLVMGILLKYLSLLIDILFKKQTYAILSIEKLN